MPQRRRTRAENRAARIDTERRKTRQAREAKTTPRYGYFNLPPPNPDDEPPPF